MVLRGIGQMEPVWCVEVEARLEEEADAKEEAERNGELKLDADQILMVPSG